MRRAAVSLALTVAVVVALGAQEGLSPAKILNPGTDSWPTHHEGSGRVTSP